MSDARITYVIGPDGAPLTVADLPAPTPSVGSSAAKAEVVAAVPRRPAQSRRGRATAALTVEEFLAWQKAIDRHGLAGLRTNRIQQPRLTRAGFVFGAGPRAGVCIPAP